MNTLFDRVSLSATNSSKAPGGSSTSPFGPFLIHPKIVSSVCHNSFSLFVSRFVLLWPSVVMVLSGAFLVHCLVQPTCFIPDLSYFCGTEHKKKMCELLYVVQQEYSVSESIFEYI